MAAAAGIYNDGNTMTLSRCGTRIEENTVAQHGAAIFVVTNDHSGDVRVEDSVIQNNHGGSWYAQPGISMHDDTAIGIVDSVLEDRGRASVPRMRERWVSARARAVRFGVRALSVASLLGSVRCSRSDSSWTTFDRSEPPDARAVFVSTGGVGGSGGGAHGGGPDAGVVIRPPRPDAGNPPPPPRLDAGIRDAGGRDSALPEASVPPTFSCVDAPLPVPVAFDKTVRDQFAAAYCAAYQRCVPNYFPSEAFCREAYACFVGAVVPPGTPESAIIACAEALEAEPPCDAELPACAFGARVATEGESCRDANCTPGLYCDSSGVPGECPICRPTKADGEPCESNECSLGHSCDATSGTCVPRKAAGDPCTDSQECGLLRCKDGTCQAYQPIGDPCDTDIDCGSYQACVSGVCAVASVPAGEPCDATTTCHLGICENGGCVQLCVDGDLVAGRCGPAGGCAPDERCDVVTARCEPRGHVGEPCVANDGCLQGLRCDGELGCVPLLEDGEPCVWGTVCLSGRCTDGWCTPRCECSMASSPDAG